MNINVVGTSGSGKSTLARRLALQAGTTLDRARSPVLAAELAGHAG